MRRIVEVQVGEYRGVSRFDAREIPCRRGDLVILDVERGMEFGRVVSDGPRPCETGGVAGKVVRPVTEGDRNQIANNRAKAQDAIGLCARKITERRLGMRLVKSEYTFDCSKIIFFFTADGRVDFRNLVKDLARVFRLRIELKQIGVRDKAKIVGGYGVCGREFCCSSYMKGFHPLSIKMAKEQHLPLNPSRISGVCGRIKCCMAYEFSVYKESARTLPRLGERISIPEGRGRVVDVHILRRLVTVDLGEGKLVKVTYADREHHR